MSPESFKEFLSRAGMTLRQAAERSGVDKSKLSRWTNGKAKLGRPEGKALERLAAEHADSGAATDLQDPQSLEEAVDSVFDAALPAAARLLANAAASGDMRAARLVIEQTRGKARQREVREKLEEPLQDKEILDELSLIEERLVNERRRVGDFEDGSGI